LKGKAKRGRSMKSSAEPYPDLAKKQFADLKRYFPPCIPPEAIDDMRLEDIEKMSGYQDPQIRKEQDERYILLEKALASKL